MCQLAHNTEGSVRLITWELPRSMPAVRAAEGCVWPATHRVCTSGRPAAQSGARRFIGLVCSCKARSRRPSESLAAPCWRRHGNTAKWASPCDVTRPCRRQGAPQEVISTSERTALAHLGAWLADLGVAPAAGGSSDEEDLADDAKARSYVHAIRDQYARHSLAPARPRRALWRDFFIWEFVHDGRFSMGRTCAVHCSRSLHEKHACCNMFCCQSGEALLAFLLTKDAVR